MLVLTRKREEKIVIGKKGTQIVITILKIQGDKVSIGIEADRGTPIYRSELLERGSVLDENHSLHNLQIDVSTLVDRHATAVEQEPS